MGQTTEGLEALAEALAILAKSGVRWWEAELYRLKGELLLAAQQWHSSSKGSGSHASSRPSPCARHQQAKSLELRAAMSLGRLWQQQGKRPEPTTCSRRSMAGSPRALTPLTSRRRRHCWRRWRNATLADTPLSPQQCWACVHNPLSVKYFHGVAAGNTHECLLKSRIGRVRYSSILEARKKSIFLLRCVANNLMACSAYVLFHETLS